MASEELKKKLCQRCNAQFPDEPCEPSECALLAAIENAEEVVRCKDCQHFLPMEGYTHVDGFCCYGGTGRIGKKATGYCNLGERRTDHD